MQPPRPGRRAPSLFSPFGMSSELLSSVFSVICVLYGAVIVFKHMAAYEMREAERYGSGSGSSWQYGGGGKLADHCSACSAPPRRKGGIVRRLAHRYPILLGPLVKEKPCGLRAGDDGVVTFAVPPIEQLSPVDRCVSQVFFFVPHALDERRLRAALDDLIRNHWTLLGARLARRRDGRLEYRLPARFPLDPDDDSYRLFDWTSARHPHGAAGIPGVLQLPTEPAGGARLQAKGGQFARVLDIMAGPGWPRERADAPGGMPMVAVHVSAFTDGAVVGVCLPHALADQMGFGSVMKAWLGLVAGTPPPPLQARPPVVLGYASRPPGGEKADKEHTRQSSNKPASPPQGDIAGGLRFFSKRERFKFSCSVIPEVLMSPREEQGTLFLPLNLVVRLRSKIFADLEERYGDDVVGRLGLSEGDVVSAILCKLANIHRSQSSSRPVSLGVVVNLRGRIPELPRGTVSYVHNAITYGFARLGKVHRSSCLSEMAYRHRLAVLHATEQETIESGLEVMGQLVGNGNKPPMIGDPGDRPFVVSNWSAAWKDLDFSAASTDAASEAEKKDDTGSKASMNKDHRTTAAASVAAPQSQNRLLVLGRAHTRDTPMRFISMVMCKTSDGYWATFAATKKNMKKVEDFLSKDPLLVSFM